MSVRAFIHSEKSTNLYFERRVSSHAKTAIIFLHGITGSRRYWDTYYSALFPSNSVYFVDLLGFGLSAKPKTTYTYETHIQSLRTFFTKEIKEKNIIIIGHSLGALIGLAYTHMYPQQIKRLFLISLPYYHTPQEAMSYVRRSIKPGYIVVDSFITQLTCFFVCFLGRALSKRLLHYIVTDLPYIVVKDSVLHTYNSYISSLYHIIYQQDVPSLITNNIAKKIVLIHGNNDKAVPVSHVIELSKQFAIPLYSITAKEHHLPIEAKAEVLTYIKKHLH